MVYSRIATGYRVGGPNSCTVLPEVPCHYAPDKTTNYEIGLKGATPEHALSFDASVYYIDWQNIQLFLTDPSQFLYTINGRSASSQGEELSAEWHPARGLTVSGWVDWNNAKLTADIPAALDLFGKSGDRLPYSSPFSGNLSVEQQFPLGAKLTGLVGGSVTFVGNRKGDFPTAAEAARQSFPSYTQLDLHGGVTAGSWAANVFVNNVADRRGIAGGSAASNTIVVIRPRTVGLSVSKSFE